MNKINKETLDLIKSFEGLKLKAYKDPVGVWTIGYGHTAAAGLPAPREGMTVTLQSASDLLLADLKKYEASVNKLVTTDLNDNQYGALVSFTYNLGEGNLRASTLLKKVNRRDFAGAAKEFAKWNKAGGKVLKGLTYRRASEAALFTKGVFLDTHSPVQPIPDDPGVQMPEVTKPSVKAPVASTSPKWLETLIYVLMKMFGGSRP